MKTSRESSEQAAIMPSAVAFWTGSDATVLFEIVKRDKFRYYRWSIVVGSVTPQDGDALIHCPLLPNVPLSGRSLLALLRARLAVIDSKNLQLPDPPPPIIIEE